jgi:hypothetical protein
MADLKIKISSSTAAWTIAKHLKLPHNYKSNILPIKITKSPLCCKGNTAYLTLLLHTNMINGNKLKEVCLKQVRMVSNKKDG